MRENVGQTCPDPARIEAYAQGRTVGVSAIALDQHFMTCRACLDRYLEHHEQPPIADIPGCHVIHEIGRGRFGVVYKAWWLRDEPRLVALKVLTSPGEMERSRFDREISALKRLDSPWIIKCIASGMIGDAKYYVMEYVEGAHLDEYVSSSSKDLAARLRVFECVCRAVASAHAQGVVHRDLKPRNILIDAQDEPHIVDFGICTVETLDRGSYHAMTITHPGDVIGTLKYMSPEQAWGGAAGSVDERSDIWALGIMLYEIVTDGQYPYSLRSTSDKPASEALLDRIRKELPHLPKLDHLPRGRDLEVLIAKCLAWEPEHRLESAQILADDLASYCAGHRIRTRPLPWRYRLQRLAIGAATRHRAVLHVGLVALVACALWLSTMVFNVGWLERSRGFEGRGSAAAMLTDEGSARAAIVLAGVQDSTIPAILDFARRGDMAGVTEDHRTWRPVHGLLMTRLASALPRAVVWDFYFASQYEGDARLTDGIKALEDAGVPVVLACADYEADGTPKLSRTIVSRLRDRLRHGAILARDMVERPGEFVLAVKRDDAVIIPTLSLVTLASILHPEATLEVKWPERRTWLELLYKIQPGSYLRERDHIELSTVFRTNRTDFHLHQDDLIACTTFLLDRPQQWRNRTVPFEEMLAMDEEALLATVANKIVLFGDLRADPGFMAPDRHRVKYGNRIIKDVPGCYLMADSIAGLLDRQYRRSVRPLPPTTFLSLVLIAGAGLVIPIQLAGRRECKAPTTRTRVLTVLGALTVLSFFTMILSDHWLIVYLAMGTTALLAPLTGAFWIEFTRTRHQRFERETLTDWSFGPEPGGTITLGSRRTKSPQTAGSTLPR